MTKVVLIGETCLDKDTYCSFKRMSPENDQVPVYTIDKEVVNEGMSQIVHKYLNQLGVEHDYLTDIYSNIVKNRVFVDDKQVCRIDEDNKSSLSAFHIDHFKNSNYSDIIVSDYGKGMLDDNIIKLINDKAKKGSRIFLDPHPHNSLWKYDNLFVLKLNRKEVEHFTHEKDFVKGCYIIRNHIKVEHIFVTLSEDGMYYNGNDSSYFVSSKVVAPKRLAGSGDVVFASIAHSMINGKDVQNTMEESMMLVKEYIEYE